MITTKEIADNLGISRSTVSRVLNGNKNVKEATRQLVLKEAQKMGYIPNQAARSLIMKKNYRVGILVFSEPLFFWQQVKKGIDQAFQEYAYTGMSTDYFVTDILKPQEQIHVMKRLIAEKYDAIALAPNDPLIMSDVIDEAMDAGIPVLLFNVDIPNSNRLCYIGSNYTQAGRLGAEILSKFMSPSSNGSVAIFTLKGMLLPIEQRTSGFRNTLDKLLPSASQQVYRFERIDTTVYQIARELIESQRASGFYISFNGLTEIAKALLDTGQNGKIPLIGYDINPEIGEYIKKQAITATIGHEPFFQGYYAIAILNRYIYNGIPPKSSTHYTKLELITEYNMQYYLEEDTYLNSFLSR